MIPAPLPVDEADRLEALRALLILDTPPEERFDRLVRFAAEEFDVPTVLISLVDDSRQWFKARHGLDACETSRDISFCGHVIADREPLVIEDATLDHRFADNPLVTHAPFIRFYAGMPLVVPGGHVLGSLCLIDGRPRRLDPTDLAILGALRDLVLGELAVTR